MIAKFPGPDVKEFRDKRNEIVHSGFSPKDDNVSADLCLKVGIPFLAECFAEFNVFNFYDALLPEYLQQIRVAQRVYQRRHASLNDASDFDVTYCFQALGHSILWSLRENYSSSWELKALTESEEVGIKFEHTHREQVELERLFGCAWKFDCPVCFDVDSTVAELDEAALNNGVVRPVRLACTNCGFVVRKNSYFLAEELLAADVERATPRILKEFGIARI